MTAFLRSAIGLFRSLVFPPPSPTPPQRKRPVVGPALPRDGYLVGADTFIPMKVMRPPFVAESDDQGVINTGLAAAYAEFLVTQFWSEHWHLWCEGKWEELVLNLQDALDRAEFLQEHFSGFIERPRPAGDRQTTEGYYNGRRAPGGSS